MVEVRVPDMIRVAPPAPTPGSILYLSDRAIFRATRALRDCGTSLPLDAQDAPRLYAPVSKLLTDTVTAMNPAKNEYQAKRPSQISAVERGRIFAAALVAALHGLAELAASRP
ncbi:MAG: hypothetical protein ACRD5L_08385 [Bryobacteraceae bacterium]